MPAPHKAVKRPKTPRTHVPKGKGQFGVYISLDLRDRVHDALMGPYKLTLTAFVERGLELALQELAEVRKGIGNG